MVEECLSLLDLWWLDLCLLLTFTYWPYVLSPLLEHDTLPFSLTIVPAPKDIITLIYIFTFGNTPYLYDVLTFFRDSKSMKNYKVQPSRRSLRDYKFKSKPPL